MTLIHLINGTIIVHNLNWIYHFVFNQIGIDVDNDVSESGGFSTPKRQK